MYTREQVHDAVLVALYDACALIGTEDGVCRDCGARASDEVPVYDVLGSTLGVLGAPPVVDRLCEDCIYERPDLCPPVAWALEMIHGSPTADPEGDRIDEAYAVDRWRRG